MTTAAPPLVKRGRGRPKIDLSIPIYTLQGSKRDRLQQIYSNWYGCDRCELSKFRSDGNCDIVFGEGNADADILVIGEAPGEEEEASSIPFTGASGKLLNKILGQTCGDAELLDMTNAIARNHTVANLAKYHAHMEGWRHEQMFFINTVACRPPENATPSLHALRACWERVWNTILTIDPLLIIAVGKTAMFTLMKKQIEITKVRGDIIDVTHEGHFGNVTYPVMPVLHPSYLLRKADWKTTNGDWEKTLDDWTQGFRVVNLLRQQHYG